MKELMDTPFQYEIAQVFNFGSVGPHYNYTVSVIANGKEIIASKVVSRHRMRDYINNYTDLSEITLIFIQDDLEYNIKPYQDNLEVVLIRSELTADPTITTSPGLSIREVFRFKGYMSDESREMITQNNPFIKDRDVMSRILSKPVTIQLVDKTVDLLRVMSVGTTVRDLKASGMDIIKTVLMSKSKEASNKANSQILGMEIAGNYNDSIPVQLSIPAYTKLTRFPLVVSNESGGIYPAGFSYYLQNQIWYIYPPYDIERYKKVQRNLTIVNLPKNRIAGIEKTYRNSNTQLVVLSTGDVVHVNYADQNQINFGNGVRFLDADRLENMGVMENNRYRVDVSKNINALETNRRSDGMSVAYESSRPITTNKYSQMSEAAARMGSFVQLSWSNSDDSLIYPGMPTRLLYLDNNQPTEAYGVVSAVETFETPVNVNFAEPKLVLESAITVFIQQSKRV